ncbi:MAG: PEGA domain-containing protein [Sedimentisphaerales bacterium]|nr:PEGA domain-containing protein [Sedimentisphaerales bacterium]
MRSLWITSTVLCVGAMLAGGCVERKLTILTSPADAVVWLNDEEVGPTPVTVNFNWYGEYRVRIEKPGYEIINTHNTMKRPLHDVFPFDFFAECLWPGRIEDSYTWTYDLAPYQAVSADQLIQQAQDAHDRFSAEMETAKQQINAVQAEKK